jgi:hypothetical protein
MKKADLKKLIKPIIKECMHEVIIESGVLSNIVSEVAKGMGNMIVEAKEPEQAPLQEAPQRNVNQEAIDLQKKRLQERREKLASSIGNDAYKHVFEGMEPMTEQQSPQTQSRALADVPARDAGVDISSIVSMGGKHWKTLAHTKKR